MPDGGWVACSAPPGEEDDYDEDDKEDDDKDVRVVLRGAVASHDSHDDVHDESIGSGKGRSQDMVNN